MKIIAFLVMLLWTTITSAQTQTYVLSTPGQQTNQFVNQTQAARDTRTVWVDVDRLNQYITFPALWLIIGYLLGLVLRQFIRSIAFWLGAILLFMLLLTALGLVTVNTDAVSNLFEAFAQYMPTWVSNVAQTLRLNPFTVFTFIIGLVLSGRSRLSTSS